MHIIKRAFFVSILIYIESKNKNVNLLLSSHSFYFRNDERVKKLMHAYFIC